MERLAMAEVLGCQETLDDPENRYKWVFAWVIGLDRLLCRKLEIHIPQSSPSAHSSGVRTKIEGLVSAVCAILGAGGLGATWVQARPRVSTVEQLDILTRIWTSASTANANESCGE